MAKVNTSLLKRRLDIAEIVRKQGEVKVDELSELLNVSGVTIRQDLNYLEQQGYLKRSFGGAIYLQAKKNISKSHHESKIEINNCSSDISLIMRCLSFINDGDTVCLLNGSITKKLIPYLYDKKNITLIVNDLSHAMLAKEYVQGEIVVIGGILNANCVIFDENNIQTLLSKYELSIVVFEIEAIHSDDEVAISNMQLTEGYQLLLKSARCSLALLPYRVVENDTFGFGSLQQFDVLILSNSTIAEYHQQIVNNIFEQCSINKYSVVYQNTGSI
ncbi:DeoR/GlpR family DNA-binding transcription regulator [uncultured Gilliamella sp.]|uniref:DeoR/GlpR family DNA-binding transcription regulator n=1 Tax=uncultured Gilliamella sp. TaxID=1193505 RepID=UPI0025D9A571|nr:DeoR/GlpR family DNA-binding transcription regulator [uncultured Gilliamella sp.]